jgi:hypothetical protein
LLGNYRFNTNKLLEKLDIEVRNAKIVASWQIIGDFTKLKYKDKIQVLIDEYHLGYSRIGNCHVR